MHGVIRPCLLSAALLIGFAASTAPGCVLPDYCIDIQTPGTAWCVTIEGARMWPIGQPELAEPS